MSDLPRGDRPAPTSCRGFCFIAHLHDVREQECVEHIRDVILDIIAVAPGYFQIETVERWRDSNSVLGPSAVVTVLGHVMKRGGEHQLCAARLIEIEHRAVIKAASVRSVSHHLRDVLTMPSGPFRIAAALTVPQRYECRSKVLIERF